MATDVNPTKATADVMWRRTRGGWAVSWKSDSVVKRVKPFPEIHLPAVSWFCHQVSSEWKKWDRQEGREEDKSHYQNPPSCWHLWQDKTEDADKEVQSVAPCASGWRWRCSAKNSLTALNKKCPGHPFSVITTESRTLSRGNLLCPSEAKVILWEPTKLKLLERRAWRDRGAAAAKQRDETENPFQVSYRLQLKVSSEPACLLQYILAQLTWNLPVRLLLDLC